MKRKSKFCKKINKMKNYQKNNWKNNKNNYKKMKDNKKKKNRNLNLIICKNICLKTKRIIRTKLITIFPL